MVSPSRTTRTPPLTTMKNPVPISPCRAITRSAGTIDLGHPVGDPSPAGGVDAGEQAGLGEQVGDLIAGQGHASSG